MVLCITLFFFQLLDYQITLCIKSTCLKVVVLHLQLKQAEILTMPRMVLFMVKKPSEPQAAQMTMLPSETRWSPP